MPLRAGATRTPRMHLLRLLSPAVLALLALAPSLVAQTPPTPPVDPVGSKLFPPEMIAGNAEMLSLSEAQQEKLRGILSGAKERFTPLGLRLKDAAEALAKAIEEKGSDAAKVMPEFERVQDCDRELKREQLRLMLELRAILSDEQRVWLTELKKKQAEQARERGERVKAVAAKLKEADSLLGEALRLISDGPK